MSACVLSWIVSLLLPQDGDFHPRPPGSQASDLDQDLNPQSPDSEAFQLRQKYTTSFPESSVFRGQTVELLSSHIV